MSKKGNNQKINPAATPTRLQLLEKEGWQIDVENNKVWAYGEEFPIVDPVSIYLGAYRRATDPEMKFDAMRHAHHILWPNKVRTWNRWQERMFRAHCGGYENIVFAGGGGIGKSEVGSEIASIFWLANPKQRAVIVASTTLDSLKSRIYGYILRNLNRMVVPYKFVEEASPPPKIHPTVKDNIHGIYAIAANKGDDEQAIKNWIGRHPEDSLLLILDEATDLPIAIRPAMSNLKKGLSGTFQAIAIGNSCSKADLHGAMATPKVGWNNINPKKDFEWETTQPKGICLYFNPYDSPAIHEPDPEKRELLGKFLMTQEQIIKAEQEDGVESEAFARFTLGYWKDASTEPTVVSEKYLQTYDCRGKATFSGQYPLVVCAGLDPSFSSGGDKCILRLAVVGHMTNGLVGIDFRGEQLVFELKIKPGMDLSAELQIADQVIAILAQYKVPIRTLCIDASGAGRGLAEVIQLRAKVLEAPTKIFSTDAKNMKKRSDGTITTSGDELWNTGKLFISSGQLKGLDNAAYVQLYSRLLIRKNGKNVLEPKADYKKRMSAISGLYSKSPDEADAAMLCLQSAILHHGFSLHQRMATVSFKDRFDESYYKAVEQKRLEAEAAKYSQTVRAAFRPGYSKPLTSIFRTRRLIG